MEDVAPRPRGAPALAAWLPVVVWCLIIFYVSSKSIRDVPSLPSDKVLHFGVYAVLGLLAARALRATGMSVARACLAGVLLASAYGVSDEWHQSFVPGRQGNDLGDIAADAAGASAGGAALALWTVRPRRRR